MLSKVVFTRENGSKVLNLAREYLIITLVTNMMVVGKMINIMDLENLLGLMVEYILGSG